MPLVFLLSFALAFEAGAWNRIDFLCIVRDAQGRPVSNLSQNSFHVLDNGAERPIVEFSHPSTQASNKPSIETIDGLTYLGAYRAIFRDLPGKDGRRILLITGTDRETMVDARRWELAFLALREHVVIYGAGPASKTVTALAEETGGRVVASQRDFDSDLAAQYHIVATPSRRAEETGTFHELQVVVNGREGLKVQAPRNYYIVPPWNLKLK